MFLNFQTPFSGASYGATYLHTAQFAAVESEAAKQSFAAEFEPEFADSLETASAL